MIRKMALGSHAACWCLAACAVALAVLLFVAPVRV
jgi:hypothetical protein